MIVRSLPEIPLMPLREVVMFPGTVMPLFVGRESSIKAIEAAMTTPEKQVCLVVQREADMETPDVRALFPIGVLSRVLQLLRLPDGTIKVLLEGLHRVKWTPSSQQENMAFENEEYMRVKVSPCPTFWINSPENEALIRSTLEALEEYGRNHKRISTETLAAMCALTDPAKLSDAIAPHLRIDFHKKQELLETLAPLKRLELVYEHLHSELAVVSIEKRIKSRVKNQMERNQREYYLTEQIKAIHKEMGRDDDPQVEITELENRLQAKNLPNEAREACTHEIKKLRQMTPSSGEYTVVRNYVDWILALPWEELKETHVDIARARTVLDGDHFGLEKPKERILEYLAVQKLTNGLKGPILCLVGPPGVGKTSLARSVATATGRDYVRISLGGVRDEAEIRGHRRTYVGAMPGKIIGALKRVKSNNPLFCLDEIDKMSADFRGDPASALLEVLDPEQNNTFNDHYLDLDYDLSHIFFITTANSLSSIPIPLQDRMEIIELSSYLDVEKRHIAKDFLLPRQMEKHGIVPEQLRLSDNALQEVIRSYTREAGVRNLERQIAALCRKAAIKVVESDDATGVSVTRQNLENLLGVKKYRDAAQDHVHHVGIVKGLAYTGVGGNILDVECVLMPGKGDIITTGKIGEVMTESVKAAFSYVRSRALRFGLRPDFHKEIDIHVHFPAGATPKDGPSAGLAIASCLVSALLDIPARHDVAMTGEVRLSGRALPIGGLREKLLAATRHSIKHVLLPRENEKDLKEVPEEILKRLTITLVDHLDEVLPLILSAPKEQIFEGDSTLNAKLPLILKQQVHHDLPSSTPQ